MAGLAEAGRVVAAARARGLRPPPRLSLSEWADREFVLSAESSADSGRWRCIPYQRAILDAFTDPAVEWVVVMKSARIGWTKCLCAALAYCVAHDPCPVMVVQPTVEDAEGFSKEEVAPMIRDVPAVARVIPDSGARDGQTILHKIFPGGSLSVVGANSGRGFRRVSRRWVLFDEVDGYPPSAGPEGDQIKLGVRRTEHYWDRKIAMGSTPLVTGASRIEQHFLQGDQRRYHVPCPHCGHRAPLVFRGEGGHVMRWPEGRPAEAYFECAGKGCRIGHEHKRQMVEAGAWVAARPFRGRASFHIWAAYSYSPNATWGQIASEFAEAAAAGAEELKTFVNTVLGETWRERGEAPDWQRLHERREKYPRGQVPAGALLVTAGVDVQRDRLVFEVVAWAADRQSWSVEAGDLPGDPAGPEVWKRVDELLDRTWQGADGREHRVLMLAVDSSDNTNAVYGWARGHPLSRVIAVKGVSGAKSTVGAPSPVDVTVNGVRLARGYRVWPVGVDLLKGELYGWLRLRPDEAGACPPGFCHFPEYGEDFFRQLTAEHLVKVVKKTGHVRYEWQVMPGRQNHQLDARVYARAAAALAGLDRYRPRAAAKPAAGAPAQAAPDAPAAAPEKPRDTWIRPRDGGRLGSRDFWRRR